jgi:hypothetical protein
VVLTEFWPRRALFAGMNKMKPGRGILGKEKSFEQKHTKTAKGVSPPKSAATRII